MDFQSDVSSITITIGNHGKADINFIPVTMSSRTYAGVTWEQLSKYTDEIVMQKFIFQHDNAAVYSALTVERYFNVVSRQKTRNSTVSYKRKQLDIRNVLSEVIISNILHRVYVFILQFFFRYGKITIICRN